MKRLSLLVFSMLLFQHGFCCGADKDYNKQNIKSAAAGDAINKKNDVKKDEKSLYAIFKDQLNKSASFKESGSLVTVTFSLNFKGKKLKDVSDFVHGIQQNKILKKEALTYLEQNNKKAHRARFLFTNSENCNFQSIVDLEDN